MTTENAAPAAATPAPNAPAPELQTPAAPAAALDGGAPAVGEGQQPTEGQAPVQTPEQIAEAERKRQDKNQRFGDLTKERNKAREEAAYWRGVAEAARNGTQPPTAPEQAAPPAPAGPPDPKDTAKYPGGEWDANYAADLAEYRYTQRREAEAKAESERKAQAAEQATFQEGLDRYNGVLSTALELADAEPGFENAEAVLRNQVVRIPNMSMDLITSADNPVHVAEYFGRKPQELQQILAMPLTKQAMVIGKLDHAISANIAAARKAAPASPPAPAAAAPQPSPAPIPQPSTGAGAAPAFDPNKSSMADYKRAREEGRFV